jgi:hypothetical protein
MGRTRSTYGRDELCIKFWSQNQKGGYHFKGLDRIDGRIMLKWILRERCVKMQTALMWDWSQALANMIINLCIKKQAGIFFTS